MVIDRYIASTIFSGVIIATMVLLGVFVFVDFVAQLKHVGTADYGNVQALLYVALRLPQRLYELSPSILLLGGILSLGAMAANSELVVLRASGVSINRIVRSVLQVGLLLALIVVLIGEFVVPASTSMAKTIRAEALEKKLIVGGYHDIWARDGNRYVNVKRVMPDHQLQDISIYELDDNRRINSIIFAESALYQDGQWLVRGLKRTTISMSDSDSTLPMVSTSYNEQFVMDRLILLELFSVLELEAKDMSAVELYTYTNYLEDNNLDANEYKLAFWIKAFMPLTCLVMLFVAMPLVFTTTPRSGGVGQRIFLAIIIGIVFFVFSRTMNFLGLALGMAPVLSVSVPLLFIVAISAMLMRRIH